MNTPSHFLIAATLHKLSKKSNIPLEIAHPRAFLWGAIAPDLPLYLLSIGAGVYYVLLQGKDVREAAELIFSHHFYENLWWIALHNFLHSPAMLLLLAVPLLVYHQRIWQKQLIWFLWGCLGHTVVDIVTHHDDGPLLFFPFNWEYRFASPVSYWDPNHHGQIFSIFELILGIALTAYLMIPWLRQRFTR